MLIIELHDRMKKGCSEAFHAAIRNISFYGRLHGENNVLRKHDND